MSWVLVMSRLRGKRRARSSFARWRALNEPLRTPLAGGGWAPGDNLEYLFYQTAVGIWPADGAPDREALGGLRERVDAYMLKAAREGEV